MMAQCLIMVQTYSTESGFFVNSENFSDWLSRNISEYFIHDFWQKASDNPLNKDTKQRSVL